MNAKELISEEIEKAGETAISPELLELDGYRITTDSTMQSEEFLLKIKGCPCFPRKDLSAITGQAKAGKTGLVINEMTCSAQTTASNKLLGMERIREEPLRVMWFDTEQSPHSTQNILKNRITRLMGGEFPEERFYVFNIRGAAVADRYNLIAEGVSTYRPDLVIVDNIRDLVRDINDGVQAQTTIESLMHLAEEFNCNITTVLHQNRSSDNRGLRGWLGTELMNKVYEVFACQKFSANPGERPTFSIEQTHTRKFDMEGTLYYQYNNQGLPELCERPKIQPRDPQGKYASYPEIQEKTDHQVTNADKFNQDYIIRDRTDGKDNWTWDYRKLFSDAIGDRATISNQDLQQEVKRLSFIRYDRYLEKVFTAAEKELIIRRDTDRCGRVVVMLLPL